jgi:hypothetical protein
VLTRQLHQHQRKKNETLKNVHPRPTPYSIDRTRSRHKSKQLKNLGQTQKNRDHKPTSHFKRVRFNLGLIMQVHVFTESGVVSDTVFLERGFCVVFEVWIEA